MYISIPSIIAALAVCALAAPSNLLEARTAADNIVYVTNANKYCMIMPRHAHTDIGASEHPGGTKTFCSVHGHYDPSQGTLPSNFWSHIDFKTGSGINGKRIAQLTGCIRPSTLDRLNTNDSGGQYDSSGEPQGSVCLGYKHYVELVEPANKRACIKCCDDHADCPVNKSTAGCPAVIPGNYFTCP